MKNKSIWLAVFVGVAVLLAPSGGFRATEPAEIGTIHFESTEVERTLEPSGASVTSGAVVRAESRLGVVHLDNGQVFKLDANSAARFEALPFDEVRVTVFSGRLSKWSAKGEALTAGAGSRFVVGRSLEDPMALERALLRDGAPGNPGAASDRRLGR